MNENNNVAPIVCSILLKNGKELKTIVTDAMMNNIITYIEDRSMDHIVIGSTFVYKDIIGIVDFKPYVEPRKEQTNEQTA